MGCVQTQKCDKLENETKWHILPKGNRAEVCQNVTCAEPANWPQWRALMLDMKPGRLSLAVSGTGSMMHDTQTECRPGAHSTALIRRSGIWRDAKRVLWISNQPRNLSQPSDGSIRLSRTESGMKPSMSCGEMSAAPRRLQAIRQPTLQYAASILGCATPQLLPGTYRCGMQQT